MRSPIVPRMRLFSLLLSLALSASVARAISCPNVMLVLDRSGSMNQDAAGGATHPSKWELLNAAVERVLMKYGDSIPFGLELFTFEDENFPTDDACLARTQIDVSPAPGTAPAILDTLSRSRPGGNTNTGEAIWKATQDPPLQDAARGQFILLITDGDPNCNALDRGDPMSNQPAIAQYTISKITEAAARNPSIKTFVVGFDGSGGVNPDNLNRMALAGGEARADCDPKAPKKPCYYSATDGLTLDAAIQGILRTVATTGEFAQPVLCDDTCLSKGCPAGQQCVTDELNLTPHCQPDACDMATCAAGSFCRSGQCIKACAAPCQTGTRCLDGSCLPDPCATVSCGGGDICDPNSGQCHPDRCLNVVCPPKTLCNQASGHCDSDPCQVVKCPTGDACKPGGNCEAIQAPVMPAPPVPTTGKHASGCSLRNLDATGGSLLLTLLCALFALRRKAR